MSPDDVTGLVEEVRRRLSASPGDLTPHRVAEALRSAGRPVGDATVLAVHEALRREVLGAGPLEPLVRLPGVTDVLVNGPGPVRIDRGRGLEESGVVIESEEACRRLAQRLVASGGRRIDEAAPFADVRLPDGTRCHAILAPLARPGTAISLRVPRRGGFDLAGLRAAGALTEDALAVLRQVVAARLAFLVSGGTQAGQKTGMCVRAGHGGSSRTAAAAEPQEGSSPAGAMDRQRERAARIARRAVASSGTSDGELGGSAWLSRARRPTLSRVSEGTTMMWPWPELRATSVCPRPRWRRRSRRPAPWAATAFVRCLPSESLR